MIEKSTKIAIIGLGLLGGSYAQGLSLAGYQVKGLDIDEQAVRQAGKNGWIVAGGNDPSLISDCDIVISALYPRDFVSWVNSNQQYLRTGAILSDVTGIKRMVISEINAILRSDVEFIACHPMAGRESRGIAYADSSQFENSNFIIVPTEENSQRAIDTAKDIASILKFGRISVLDAERHDQIIGFVSQLCHVIAVSLMNISDDPMLIDYTGDSFRDLTRIANINEDLWPQLFIANKDNLSREIDAPTEQLNQLKEYIVEEDVSAMRELMIRVSERRKKFDRRK
ncbi:MAG: prephenate dehydrogenase [Erysipelotrichaceae bacterium]|nr:prephenate dehydrogenase [Erysipelotrichaceae bacterium]